MQPTCGSGGGTVRGSSGQATKEWAASRGSLSPCDCSRSRCAVVLKRLGWGPSMSDSKLPSSHSNSPKPDLAEFRKSLRRSGLFLLIAGGATILLGVFSFVDGSQEPTSSLTRVSMFIGGFVLMEMGGHQRSLSHRRRGALREVRSRLNGLLTLLFCGWLLWCFGGLAYSTWGEFRLESASALLWLLVLVAIAIAAMRAGLCGYALLANRFERKA